MAQRFLTIFSWFYRIPLFAFACIIGFFNLFFAILLAAPFYLFTGRDLIMYFVETHIDKIFDIFDL